MSSKTRIIVLHMKEVVYTIAFLILAILLGVLIYFMFGPGQEPDHIGKSRLPLYSWCLPLFHHIEPEYL